MKFINNLKIRTKILLSFFIILFFSAAIVSVSSINIININDRNKTIFETSIAPLESLMQVEVAFANVRQTSRGFIIRITSDPTQLEKQEERLQGLLDTMSSSIDAYIQTLIDCGSSQAILDNSRSVKTSYYQGF